MHYVRPFLFSKSVAFNLNQTKLQLREISMIIIGKLSAEIPWSNIYTKPVVVTIEDVFVLATPLTGNALKG